MKACVWVRYVYVSEYLHVLVYVQSKHTYVRMYVHIEEIEHIPTSSDIFQSTFQSSKLKIGLCSLKVALILGWLRLVGSIKT